MAKKCKICKSPEVQLQYRTAFMTYMCDECYLSERKRVLEEKKKAGKVSVKLENKPLHRVAKKPDYYSEYQKVCASIVKERDYSCRGCGASNVALDFSHTVARSQAPQLICDPNNIELMCRGCHLIWENGEINNKATLHNFRDMASYMRSKAYPLYVKLMLKLGLELKDIPNDPNLL
jgi:5-methylcytosine-specific restriction endonuclease McrA